MRDHIDIDVQIPDEVDVKTVDDAAVQGPDLPEGPVVVSDSDRSPEELAFLYEHGQSLVAHIFSAAKTIRLYNMNNRAVQRALADLEHVVALIVSQEGRAQLRTANEYLLLNEQRLPVESHHYGPIEFVVSEMKKREVEVIEFDRGADAQQIGEFIKVLVEAEEGDNAYQALQESLEAASVKLIRTAPLEEKETALVDVNAERHDVRRESNRVYFRTVALMGDILRTIEEKHILHVRKAKRLTQQMTDIIQTDESLLVGLASIKNFDSYTFMHSVNVCILAMLMGDRMRLSKNDVARLGVAALFHDIGKTYIPSSILNSTGELTSREWELMKYHTFFGVKELSRIRSLRDAVDPMFVALQHHVHYNDNGYPQRPGGWRLRLFSRIVTVADYYDAMTANRAYQKEPVTPDKALRFILEKSGEIFDPFIAKVFIQAMGLYPIGTLVELTTGELGVVTRQNGSSRFIHRPTVQIVDENVANQEDWDLVDLTERLDGEYRFKRSVVRAIHDSDVSFDKKPVFVTAE